MKLPDPFSPSPRARCTLATVTVAPPKHPRWRQAAPVNPSGSQGPASTHHVTLIVETSSSCLAATCSAAGSRYKTVRRQAPARPRRRDTASFALFLAGIISSCLVEPIHGGSRSHLAAVRLAGVLPDRSSRARAQPGRSPVQNAKCYFMRTVNN